MTSSIDELGILRAEKLRRLYQTEPEAYANDILRVQWAPQISQAARALIKHRRVKIKASHSVGKTHFGGGLINWFFDCFNPSITLSTAPSLASVIDLLWKEVRVQRGGRPGLLPKSPRMETSPDHFAAGYTANDADAFQGRHENHMLIIFDEAVGVDNDFWDARDGMLTTEGSYALDIYNPTDVTSRAYLDELSNIGHLLRISCIDHPNIQAELEGRPRVFPGAVSLAWLIERLENWCEPIAASDKTEHDIEFPPGSGKWYRPDARFESRVLGRWPRQGANSVWSDALWDMVTKQLPVPEEPLTIGCDVARFGDDDSAIHVRRGPCSLHHEAHNGWSTSQVAGRLKQLAKDFVQEGEDPKTVATHIDDDGVGGGVVDQADGWNFIPISSAEVAVEKEDYPNRRSELWFTTAQKAREKRIDLSRLSPAVINGVPGVRPGLRAQLMATRWKMDAQGRRVVEPKDELKKAKRLGRSPDDADAFNLSHATPKMLNEIEFTIY